MKAKRPIARCQKLCELFLTAIWIFPGFATGHGIASQEPQFSESLVRQRISFLISRTIESSTIKLKDGSSATSMPVTPTSSDLDNVKRLGEQAVKELATYTSSTRAMEQHVSLRFLLEFHSDAALAALRAFAEGSKFAGIRQEATAGLKGFPPEKVKPIIERISKSDPNSDVRSYARQVLASYVHGDSGPTR